MSKTYKITNKGTGKECYIRFVKDVADYIGKGRTIIWRKFKENGFYENKQFKVEKIEIL